MLIDTATGLKRCSSCKEHKAAEHFSTNSKQKDGLHNQCRPCKRKSISPEAKARGALKSTILNRYKWSGFTQEDFKKKLLEQGKKCAICKTEDPGKMGWQADHCHKTKTKRGLLCRKCNLGISYFNDDPNALLKAIQYIDHYTS